MPRPRPSKHYLSLEKKWLGRRVVVYIEPHGHVRGIVRGLSNNEAEAEFQGRAEYGSDLGLLVEVPELGRNVNFGEWPVTMMNAELEP